MSRFINQMLPSCVYRGKFLLMCQNYHKIHFGIVTLKYNKFLLWYGEK